MCIRSLRPRRIVAPFFAVSACAALLPALCSGQNAPAQSQATPIYIPADKRHKGLSRFDGLPFTDRKLGDPDRYRALNPKWVKHENGHYYFLLQAQPGTPVFDAKHKLKALLTQMNDVPVDLTDTIQGTDENGKATRFVFVKDKGYVQLSRLTSVAKIKRGKWFQFPIKAGATVPFFDGAGIQRGTLAVASTRLNYGQQKTINGQTCYYAFSTSIIPTGAKDKSGASGWIPASAIEPGNDPGYSDEVVRRMQPTPTGATDKFTHYELAGGDPMEKNADGTYRWGYLNGAKQFIPYKVLPGVSLAKDANVASTDYIQRADGVINLGFNCCGVSNDTYRVSGPNRPLAFYRSSDKDAFAVVDLFYPEDGTHTGREVTGKMEWVYGYVDEKPNKRWGWVPLGALKPAP